ncbi:MAG: hypothetical protein A2Y14_05285 [Verrucomicrobia bacterium GWF2_51_19]|nr:MAG: hypothetical protein A2Y14_05285 [Verrucomicrobia bacterium GWF2_51_19]HCJ12336.1 hypothetical protein [Opitutae bacterium]
MNRFYLSLLVEHFKQDDQMAFLCGPRQVGKTTLAKQVGEALLPYTYLNWDSLPHREQILTHAFRPLPVLGGEKRTLLLDEIHKYRQWKSYLKGLYDTEKAHFRFLVTGSAKLNIFRRSEDSLMGRYFLYRIHPLSVAECVQESRSPGLLQAPKAISFDAFDALFQWGGFPEPFIKQSQTFHRRWQRLRQEQTLGELRDLTQIQQLAKVEVLAELLHHQAGQLVNYSQLAKKVRVAVNTIIGWTQALSQLYFCFFLKPWSKNLSRSLLKEPKCYLWDWSTLEDLGARCENFVASHLLKATQFWTDAGLGDYQLYFLRTKDQKEVDFLVTENKKPWFLVEVNQSHKTGLSPHLKNFQQALNAPHAFQVAFDLPFVAQDCFAETSPVIVPATTFLSQLV